MNTSLVNSDFLEDKKYGYDANGSRTIAAVCSLRKRRFMWPNNRHGGMVSRSAAGLRANSTLMETLTTVWVAKSGLDAVLATRLYRTADLADSKLV